MTTVKEAAQERRSESHLAIRQLIDHRTQMLALYSELAAHRPFKDGEFLVNLLQRFCQSLVDYTADAHFRLYHFFDTKQERRTSVAHVAQSIYPHISESTQLILDFNDKYDSEEKCHHLVKNLESDLSKLGEILADRIELEDGLVEALTSPRERA